MSNRMLCTICARGGSKGVANKNIKQVAGKPLIAHTLDVAIQSGLFDEVLVSSDCKNILNAAKEHGATILLQRPNKLATDTISKLPVISHAAKEAEKQSGKFDILVDLDVTSPLRTIEDVKGAVKLLETTQASNVITGSISRRSPYFNLVEQTQAPYIKLSKVLPEQIVRRQDSMVCYDMNASIYVWPFDKYVTEPYIFTETTALYEMPTDRSWDVDEEFDFLIVEFLLERKVRMQHGGNATDESIEKLERS